MMLRVYRGEILKLRHSKIYLGLIISAVLGNIFSLVTHTNSVTGGWAVSETVKEMFSMQASVTTTLGPFIFALITGYIVTREYSERTINQLFSYPISRIQIFAAKMGVVFTYIVLMAILSSASAFIYSMFKLFTGAVSYELVFNAIWMNLVACFLSFAAIPLAALLAMYAKNIIAPIVLGAFATFGVSILELTPNGGRMVLFPWAMPTHFVHNFGYKLGEVAPNPYMANAFIVLAAMFLVSSIICLIYYKKMDVHSGS